MHAKITPDRLQRKAVVYVRQSSMGQVMHNQESQRRQYGLAERASELGFRDVMVIDEDLGRSGSGTVERPGFQRLVGEVCTGEVGAVFCIEASRLARNGRDWHHLIELCGMTDVVVIDPDGIYDPAIINDRLLLGLKGTMSEFELNLLRQRSVEAIRQKARRGELRYCLPAGYVWTNSGRIDKHPDQRIQQALGLVFLKMTELGSIRQVLLWFRRQRVELPARDVEDPAETRWALPVYNTVHKILTNPMFAGAYAFGKTCARTAMVDGRARKTIGHKKARSEWTVLLHDHHPGYISWEQYERNQAVIAANAHMKSRMQARAARGGKALLAGLIRCRRCGRMLHIAYSGSKGLVPRYHCRGAHVNHGEDFCISFGGARVDDSISREILQAISGNAIEAAVSAAEKLRSQQQEQRRLLELELEQARYEARLACRRYEAVDPDNRLVAAELEARWNAGLQKAREIETRISAFDAHDSRPAIPDSELLMSLAHDLPSVWRATSTMRLKQRIVRILIEEIVADVDEKHREVVLLIHWTGRHSQLKVKKKATGQHNRTHSPEAVEVTRRMASSYSDEQIAATMNRMGLRTGTGNSWNEQRVYALRRSHHLPPATSNGVQTLTLEQTAERLGVSATCVRHLIERKLLPATQAIECAPWQIAVSALESPEVRNAVSTVKNRLRRHGRKANEQQDLFSRIGRGEA
ncbi:MAG TPA: recombinase family protein [Bryobacteraceae bacterium]|jgi:DNA invertase Pin-like site-specific DNA recombinase|nr:recombinase family protein [Bryobacteraceae bacterium]